MKRIFLVLWLALSTLAVPVLAQTGSVSVSLTAQSTDCTVANSCAVLNIGQNVGGAALTLVGTWSGTVQFEGEGADGKTWVAISVTPSNSTTTVTSATGNGTWQVNVSGYKAVRIRCSTFTSGTINASISSSTASARGGSGGGGGGSGTISPGTTNTIPKYTNGAGAVIGNSKLTDSGTLLSYTSTGTFVSGSRSDSANVVVNGPCPTSLFGGANTTMAVTGCTVTPSSGVTNGINVGVGGFAEPNDSAAGGLFGNVYGVGGYFVSYCPVNSTTCEGAVSVVTSAGSLTGVQLYGNEVSTYPSNTGDVGAGILLDFLGDTVQPDINADKFPAIDIQTPSGMGTFTSGFKCEPGSLGVHGYCIELGKMVATPATATASQRLLFTASDGSSDFSRLITLEPSGVYFTDAAPIIGLPGAYGNYLTSTAALSYNQLVKIDTSNPDSVVVCTTSDTTACMGFVADKLGSGTGGLCTMAGTCAIVTVPGSVVKGILGTGTCAIGDYVIVDTTTNGRIKCTGSAPLIHVEIGLALSAQTMVGSLVDILTKFE